MQCNNSEKADVVLFLPIWRILCKRKENQGQINQEQRMLVMDGLKGVVVLLDDSMSGLIHKIFELLKPTVLAVIQLEQKTRSI